MRVLTRMMIAFLVCGVLGAMMVQIFTQKKLEEVYLRPIEDDLVDFSMILAEMIAWDPETRALDIERVVDTLAGAAETEMAIEIYDRAKTDLGIHVYITDRDGVLRFDSRQGERVGETLDWRDVRRTLQGRYGARATWSSSNRTRALSFYVGAPIFAGDEIVGVVSVGKRVPHLAPIYEDMRKEALVGGLIAILLGTALGLLFIVWITRPIRYLTEYAQSIRDGLRVALPDLGNSDIGRLGESFEEMRDALEGKQYVEQYVQTLTHEIKSPLAAIRGAVELLDEDMPAERRAAFMDNIRTETDRIGRLVERMLQLSSLEKKKELANAAVLRVREVIEEVVSSQSPVIEAREIQLEVINKGPFQLEGERFLIRQAVNNLIQNAIEFTPRGGEVTVTVEDRAFSVRDSGPGVPDYARARVFERFYSLRRPDTGKKSSGLGLTIVKQVAELHGCEVTLENASEGGAIATFRQIGERPRRGMRTIPPTRLSEM